MIDSHTIIHRQNIAFHRSIARRLRSDPSLIGKARDVIERWSRLTPRARYVDEWRHLLDAPIASVIRAITTDDDHAAWLRSVSPFILGGALPKADRDRIRRFVRHRLSSS